MRYELDANGYVKAVAWGCSTENGTEYTGTIPNGYIDLIDWSENALINAYYIDESGNLVLDSGREEKLRKKIEQEAIDNAPVTHKELCKTSAVIEDEFVKTVSGTKIIEINNAGEYNIPKIILVGSNVSGDVQIVSSNKNLLKNDATTKEIDGITFTINNNKSITLNGTATSDIEFNLSGDPTSTEMLFLIKENTEYITSGLSQGVSLSLYSCDETGRTLLNSGGNEIIKLSMANVVTQAILNIASGTTFDEVTISPQIEKGTDSTSYETHKSSYFTTTISNNRATILNEINSYNPYTIIMIDKDMDMSVDYYEYKSLVTKFSEIKATEDKITARVGTAEGDIAQLSMDVSKIRSEIGDITDITVSEEGMGTLTFTNINESDPIDISIHPTNEDISYLYPSDNLYPSDDLFLKDRLLQFTNTTDGTIQTYLIPGDLRYYNNTYDEFSLNYDSQICQIKRRIGVNSDGSKYVLETEVVENYDYPSIPLTSGDYSITLLGYTDSYMKIRLMCQNMYTTQFATKVELNSKVTQTANEISSEVSKKVGNNEVISKINQTAEAITINANKVNIAGVITAINNNTTTTIDGDKITTGSITANKVASDVITTNNFSSQTINADRITSGTINGSKVNVTNLNASNISSGTIDASKVVVKNLNANNITGGTISCDMLFGGTINGQKISGGSVSGSAISGGSINITKGDYYFNMGTKTSHPNCSGLNVGSAVVINGIELSKSNGRLRCWNDFQVANLYTLGNIQANNYIASASINLLAGGSSGSASNGGILLRTGNGHITLDASNGGGYVYAEGVGTTNAKVTTASGSASSKNTKTNIKEFTNENYEDALELLKNIVIYSYDYKYDLYEKREQYGFIIDEIEKQKNYDKFFDFKVEKAKVDGEHLDFAVSDDENTIEVKQYDANVLDKYLLTCIKALQNKIDTLENKIEELESDK